ncbi:hypothetical protein ABDK56_06310 [Sphingomonas sp. ASV193]|uniref:hypothetical protein n=1 Tax=Sphingomonas sp. ASV193 TaxID=3144405 RepID=UPI0032E87E1D
MNKDEAIAALGSVDAANAALARAASCPPWRHAAFGALMGLLVFSAGQPVMVQSALTAACMGGVAVIAVSDRRRMGVFVNGYRKGATLPVTLALLGVMLVLIFAELHARDSGLSLATKAALALAAAAIGTAGSVRWQRIYRRELGVTA